MKLNTHGMTDVGKKRTRNEDCFLVNDDLSLYVVADGMGGHCGGEFASRLAVSTIDEVIQSLNTDPEATIISGVNSEEADHGDRLRYAIEVASQKIYDQGLYDQQLKGMGTTTAALMVSGVKASIANVGDSRVYLIREGKISQVTRDHSLISEQVRAGLLSEGDAKKHKLKNIITRSVGYQEAVEIDIFKIDLSDRDRLVLCSDGLTNMLDDDTICRTAQNGDIKDACRKLVNLANERGGEDNITVILCEFQAS